MQDSSKPVNILHIGSYRFGANDIVNLMQKALARIPGVNVIEFDARLYVRWFHRFVQPEGGVNWIKDEVVDRLISEQRPDVIICNAGGLSVTPSMHEKLAHQQIPRVMIALSDPDDFASRSRRYAGFFDFCYTNATRSIADYDKIGVAAKLLPFAAHTTLHRPLNVPKKTDVVIVGERRPDRVRMVKRLCSEGLRVGCYGNGWRGKVLDKLHLSTAVHGEKHAEAINSGVVYISFTGTRAGFTNVKVGLFEAAACGACILVEDFEELHDYFMPGREVCTYQTEDEAVALIKELCANPDKARALGAKAHERVLAEHTWEHRWQRVLDDVQSGAPGARLCAEVKVDGR